MSSVIGLDLSITNYFIIFGVPFTFNVDAFFYLSVGYSSSYFGGFTTCSIYIEIVFTTS